MNHDDVPDQQDTWSNGFATIATAIIFSTLLAMLILILWKLLLNPLWQWAT